MSVRGIEDVELFEGAVDGDKFCHYLGESVLPSLLPFYGVNSRSLLVMDNASLCTMSTKCRKDG